MNKIDFYQITDGQTGAQVASGLDDNFNAEIGRASCRERV